MLTSITVWEVDEFYAVVLFQVVLSWYLPSQMGFPPSIFHIFRVSFFWCCSGFLQLGFNGSLSVFRNEWSLDVSHFTPFEVDAIDLWSISHVFENNWNNYFIMWKGLIGFFIWISYYHSPVIAPDLFSLESWFQAVSMLRKVYFRQCPCLSFRL